MQPLVSFRQGKTEAQKDPIGSSRTFPSHDTFVTNRTFSHRNNLVNISVEILLKAFAAYEYFFFSEDFNLNSPRIGLLTLFHIKPISRFLLIL